jgi:hypothetical protein
MDTLARILYFGSILAAFPMFVGLSFGALRRLAGWMRLLPLPPIAYIAWRAFDELAPALLHAGELDTAEFQRLLYERWSALSRPALYASALMLGLLGLGILLRARVAGQRAGLQRRDQ